MAKTSSKGSSGRSAPRGSSSTPVNAPKPSTPKQGGLSVPAYVYQGKGR